MITRKVALISKVKGITISDLARVGAAIQKQVHRDFAAPWGVDAIVSAFAKLEDVPIDYWPVKIVQNVQDAAGYHEDKDGQPYALVEASADWSVTTSHEVLEMLADPWGRNMVAGPSPKKGQGRVRFLVEVCDPSEASTYSVNEVTVSDFYLPSFFEPVHVPGTRYSYTGVIHKPRQILQGGYLSWQDLATEDWWQEQWFNTPKPVFENLGPMDARANPRSFIDRITGPKQRAALHGNRSLRSQQSNDPKTWTLPPDATAIYRAKSLRGQIAHLIEPK